MAMEHLSFDISFAALGDFLDHWSSRYPDPKGKDKKLYDPHIEKGAALQGDRKAINDLFKWKNGGEIAEKKLKSVRDNYLGAWTADDRLECRYLNPDDKRGGPIWNIYYLHCRRPDRYPIYDQHAYRAMEYIRTGSICDNLSNKPKVIYESYREYRSFVEAIRQRGGQDLRTIDRALFTFGRFLKKAKPFLKSNV